MPLSMVLYERELSILAFLLRYKYLETTQVKKQFFSHQSKANQHRVLKKLIDLRLIEKRTFPKTTKLKMGYLLHLTDKGAKVLANHFETSVQEIGYKRITTPLQSINRFYHRKRMIDFWIKLDNELKEEESQNLVLSHFITDTERERRAGKLVAKTHIDIINEIAIVPDMIFKIKDKSESFESLYFVEIDAGTETIGGQFIVVKPSMILDKFQKYQLLYQKGSKCWANVAESHEQFRILFVTENQTHIKNIQQKSINVIPEILAPLFLFSTHDIVEQQGILGENIWTDLAGNKESLA